jgi:hypothetical protein
MEKGFWIEKSWGGSVDNARRLETAEAFEHLQNTAGHGTAFWIGCYFSDYVLKACTDKQLVLIYGENQDLEIRKTMKDWAQCILLADLLLAGEFQELLQYMQST